MVQFDRNLFGMYAYASVRIDRVIKTGYVILFTALIGCSGDGIGLGENGDPTSATEKDPLVR